MQIVAADRRDSIPPKRDSSFPPKKNSNPTKSSQVKTINLLQTHDGPFIDTVARVNMLSAMLTDPHLTHQYTNILSVIAMYELGMVPTTTWWFVDGRFFGKQPEVETLPYGSALFLEVCFLPR